MSNAQKKSKNKTTTFGTGKNTAMVNNDNFKIGKNENNSDKKINLNENDLETRTKELSLELDNIKLEIEKEINISIKENTELNTNLNNKGLEIADLSSQNKNLNEELHKLKSMLDNKIQNGKKFSSKMEKLKNEEAKLNKDIVVKDKEIDLTKRAQIIKMKDLNLIKNIVKNNDEEKENILLTKLQNLEKDKKKLEDENSNLKKIIKEHNMCTKSKSDLLSKLNIMKNSFQFEIKNLNMIKSNIEEKKEKNKNENKDKINPSNRNISYSNKLRLKVIKKMKEKNSQIATLPNSSKKHIENVFINIQRNYYKNSGETKNINNNNYKMNKNSLFNCHEESEIPNIIGDDYCNEFKQRFECLENQRYQKAKELQNNQNRHQKFVNLKKSDLTFNKLRKKECDLRSIDIKNQLQKKREKIKELKTEIKTVKKEINQLDKKLKNINEFNQKLQKILQSKEKITN